MNLVGEAVEKIESLSGDALKDYVLRYIEVARSEGRLKSDVSAESVIAILASYPAIQQMISPESIRGVIVDHLTNTLGDHFINLTMANLRDQSEKIKADFSLSKDHIKSLVDTKVSKY